MGYPNYIPSTDTDLANWADNFNTLLTASPPTYGLVAGDATAVNTVVVGYLDAYAASIAPTTRTPVTISAKDDAKILMLATVRPFAQNISLNQGIISSDKIAIGVNPRTNTSTKIPIPTTYPVLTIPTALNLGHVLRYRDQLSEPTVKAKPFGATALQLFATASATVIADQTLLAYNANLTKSPATVLWEAGDVGKTAYYAARWVNEKGQQGPWSAIISATIGAL